MASTPASAVRCAAKGLRHRRCVAVLVVSSCPRYCNAPLGLGPGCHGMTLLPLWRVSSGVREIVAFLDGALSPFPYDASEGVHACEILLGIRASQEKNGAFVPLPMAPDDKAVAVARWA